ncbi:MAG: AraC family transcriptional regulator [Solidesulfovibrio sp.]|uniref:AraC family transcriptional regulator n=1 Tax=Solidesulfovibrio sp. TaxID=2910990 RepID=UPI002B2201EB|nr:AraC family transcriptional regulator [Solidesulfovibrio sp.]MEA4856301.1 AraC family transcriptional regulator [Solidesulfovibrio sp.]
MTSDAGLGALPHLPLDRRMADLIAALATNEGVTATDVPGVSVMRSSRAQPRRPVVYTPSVVIVAQGRKVGYVGETVHVYDRDHYLVLSVLMPFECEIALATPQEPFLGLKVAVDTVVLGELMMALEAEGPGVSPVPAVCSSRLPPQLRDAALRLLSCLSSRQESRVLGPQFVREILYRVLQSDQGLALRALSGVGGNFGQIARALQRIHVEYASALDVESLAGTAGMSVSAFHQHFKTVTASSPIQYIKSIRLHKARLLMAKAGHSAKSASVAVGYASTSQFSREFKRFFGASPGEEASRVRHLQLEA